MFLQIAVDGVFYLHFYEVKYTNSEEILQSIFVILLYIDSGDKKVLVKSIKINHLHLLFLTRSIIDLVKFICNLILSNIRFTNHFQSPITYTFNWNPVSFDFPITITKFVHQCLSNPNTPSTSPVKFKTR